MPTPPVFVLRVLQLALFAALVATPCDAVHVATGTLRYPEPFLFGQGAFVYPGFVGAFVSMALAYAFLAARLPASIPRGFSTSPARAGEMVETLTTFAIVYVLSGYGNESPSVLAVVFYGTALLRLAFTRDRRFMAIVALILGLMGMAVEGTMTVRGIVHYREPEVYGVPLWLGALYMHGAFALRDGMRFFVFRPLPHPAPARAPARPEP